MLGRIDLILPLGDIRCDPNPRRLLLLSATALHEWVIARRRAATWGRRICRLGRRWTPKTSRRHRHIIIGARRWLLTRQILRHVFIIHHVIPLLLLFHLALFLLIKSHLLLELAAILVLSATLLGHLGLFILVGGLGVHMRCMPLEEVSGRARGRLLLRGVGVIGVRNVGWWTTHRRWHHHRSWLKANLLIH